MEEAPENSKETLHYALANRINEWAVTSHRVIKLFTKIVKQLVDNKFAQLTLITRPHSIINTQFNTQMTTLWIL
jgi:hypothetical protein